MMEHVPKLMDADVQALVKKYNSDLKQKAASEAPPTEKLP